MKTAIVILTLNAGLGFKKLLESLKIQEAAVEKIVVADSGSVDGTIDMALKYGCEILPISRDSFNHGDSRKTCVAYLTGIDIVVFLTQDVILADKDSIGALLQCFYDTAVGAAYGRQLPHTDASPLAAQNRLFNYPKESKVKTFGDRFTLGIKAPFMSDSFAAYRIGLLQAVGNFPHVIVSEDMYAAAKLLMAGYKVAYIAEACVYHSHNYTIKQELARYFDIGVFMRRESWITIAFGTAEGEGVKLVKEQLKYLYKNYGWKCLPKAIAVNIVKFIGYRLGMYECFLPVFIKRKISGQPYFFN